MKKNVLAVLCLALCTMTVSAQTQASPGMKGQSGPFQKGTDLILTPYVRYTIANIEKFSFSLDAMGQFGLIDAKGFRVGVRPIVAWMATKHWTAAFSVGFLGYDKMNYYDHGAFVLDFETAAPSFGLYYNF